MGERQLRPRPGLIVPGERRDIAVAVVAYTAFGDGVVRRGGGAGVVRRINQALKSVIDIAVGVRRGRRHAVVRGKGRFGDVAVEPFRAAGLGGRCVADRLLEHQVLTPVVPGGYARGPSVDVIVEVEVPNLVRSVSDRLSRQPANLSVLRGALAEL